MKETKLYKIEYKRTESKDHVLPYTLCVSARNEDEARDAAKRYLVRGEEIINVYPTK